MTKYRVEFNKNYLKDLEKIPIRARKQIQKEVTALASEPRPDGCKKLQGANSPPLYRVRCGDYRIIYTINDSVLLILVIAVGHRKEIYRT
jgi:mRNA interferase RelE/StbE